MRFFTLLIAAAFAQTSQRRSSLKVLMVAVEGVTLEVFWDWVDWASSHILAGRSEQPTSLMISRLKLTGGAKASLRADLARQLSTSL